METWTNVKIQKSGPDTAPVAYVYVTSRKTRRTRIDFIITDATQKHQDTRENMVYGCIEDGYTILICKGD